jgi:CheY-like chemotaxis protein
MLDIKMPVMDRYEAAFIEGESRDQGHPVIFLTAKAEMEYEIKGFELAPLLITKPINRPSCLPDRDPSVN